MKKIVYILIILIAMIPTLAGYLTNTEMHFSGLTSATDGNNYLSIMNQAKEGRVLFTNMYTYEEVPYLNIRPTFMFAGWVSFITGLSNIFVYHLFRILGIIFFIFYLEKLLSLYFNQEKYKNITLLICLFGAGIGFFFKFITLFGIKQYGSIDLWITDANNFLILLSHAHTIFSVGLMTACVYYFLLWNNKPELRTILISSVFAFVLGFEHLFDVITIYLAIGFLMLEETIRSKKIDWLKVKHLILFGAITSVPFIYTYAMFLLPIYAAWNAQNVLDTPKLLHVIFGYGIMFAAFVGYLVYGFKNYSKIKPEVKFLLFWIISVLILIYSPFNIQRRFFEGVHIPFGIITGIFLFMILKPYLQFLVSKKLTKIIILLIIIFMLPTNMYHLFNKSVNVDNERGSYPYNVNHYLYPEEHDALNWLAENSELDSVIISTYNIGNHIPGYMNRRVYLGHWAQTVDLDTKNEKIDKYFKGDYSAIVLDKTTYVWYGVDEKELNPNFVKPDNSDVVFENEKVIIFKI